MANGLYAAIAQGGTPIQIENPLNQMAKIAAIRNAQQEQQLSALKFAEAQASAQQERQLNALKIQEAQTSAEELAGLRNVLAGAKDLSSPETRAELMRKGLKGLEYVKGLTAQEKANLETTKLRGEITAQDLKRSQDRLTDLYANPSNENILAHLQDDLLKNLITPQKAQEQWARYSAMTPEQRQNEFRLLSMGITKYTELNKPTLKEQEFGGGTRIVSIPGLGGPATEVAGSRIAKTISPDTAARLAQERDLEFQSNLAKAKEFGQTVGKSGATAQAALPGAVATAEQTIGLIDQMIGDAKIDAKTGKITVPKGGRTPHPGFQEYVGATLFPFKRFIEGTDVAGYERYQKQVEGRAFLDAFEALKGGGAITEVEGAKGTQAIMRMNKAQNEKEYIKAARELQDIVRSGVERAKAKAGAAGAATPAVSAPSATGNIHDQARRILEGR